MRARIHRGASEVGGNCVELEAQGGERLLLDLGLPLGAEPGAKLPLPAVAGLTEHGDTQFLGVVLSHAHPDHYGLLEAVEERVPLYAGAATTRILAQASFFTPLGLAREPAAELRDREPLKLGPFTLVPYLVDHSAYDAYAILVDADDRRLFYSADLRAHGRKSGLFERLVAEPPRGVNTLLLEGTSLGRPSGEETRSEAEVEAGCAAAFSDTEGMALACYSPQNVDRHVTAYRAARRAGRELVIDLYGAAVAAATTNPSIPQAQWSGVRVYVPQAQRVRVKRSGEFERVEEIAGTRVFAEELAADPQRWVVCFRASMLAELARTGCLDRARLLWLMWPGYLDRESGQRLRAELDRHGIELEVLHASGHAAPGDLRRLARAIDAEQVVPIHTDVPERYPEHFEHVALRSDGAWWEV